MNLQQNSQLQETAVVVVISLLFFKFYNKKLIISIGLLAKIWGLFKMKQNGFINPFHSLNIASTSTSTRYSSPISLATTKVLAGLIPSNLLP